MMDPANSATHDDAEDAAMQAAFDSDTEDAPVSAESEMGAAGPQGEDAGTADGQVQHAETQAPTPGTEASEAPAADDPFGALPPEVRALLARVPAMQSDLADAHKRTREIEGLARSLQSRLDRAEAAAAKASGGARAAPESTPAPSQGRKLEKLERVRATLGEDLPEVVEALDELANLLPPENGGRYSQADELQPKGADSASGAVDPVIGAHLQTLDELRPGWFEELESDDAQLWLAGNRDMATRYAQADTPAKLLKILEAFDGHRSRSGKAQRAAVTSQARRSAGVVPDGQPRTPARGRVMSEEEAMEQAFRS